MSYYADDTITVHHGDCLDVLATLPDASMDAVVTDPPYGLEFMGKEWDSFGRDTGNGYREAPRINDRDGEGFPGHRGSAVNSFQAGPPFQQWCQLWATECLRVLKPGGHLLAFGGTRTSHRLACAVEDAGFEIRDSIAWLYGSGFPKSLDVSKAIDKAAGAERGVVTAPASDAARTWQGWGTALKPAHEPIVVARKPLAGTVAANVLEHGVGALNIDGCRVGEEGGTTGAFDGTQSSGVFAGNDGRIGGTPVGGVVGIAAGRWPANVVLDETQAAALDKQSGESVSNDPGTTHVQADGWGHTAERRNTGYAGDRGGASRFFYTAKADAAERVRIDGTAHPTVKPLALMRWLVRLVTPPGGIVLEPFAGSGTTVEACILEGFRCVAIEREADYLPLILQRIHRRRDPVAAVRATAGDGGLFDLLEEDEPA